MNGQTPGAPAPIEGVRVLDLADRLGAYGPRLLAGLGADVVLVEPPEGSPRRTRTPRYDLLGVEAGVPGLYCLHYDAGKRSVALDTEVEEGREAVRRLLDVVDVVVDNGQLAAWGFDLEALTADRPLVVVSLTSFGLSGPRSHWQGGDLICQVMGGMDQIYGFRNERPMRIGQEQASEMGGLAVALATLVALYGARADGTGEVVDIALERVCALVTLQMSNASMYHQFGFLRRRAPREAPRRERLYRARDGWLAFGAARNPAGAVEVLRRLGVADELERLLAERSAEDLVASGDAEGAVSRALEGVTRAQVLETAQSLGVISMPVQDAADIAGDPFLRDRAFFVDLEHPELGTMLSDAALPFLFNGRRAAPGRRPPLLGEHTEEVLGWAGYARGEIEAMQRADPSMGLRTGVR
jgi:benzylsuccinate CoA-transferase BbsE subunit